MIRSSQHHPVYREVLAHAIKTAWHDRQYWILALLAGMLVTAGSYDVLWNAVTTISTPTQFTGLNVGGAVIHAIVESGSGGADSILTVLGGIESLMLISILVLFVAGISCIAQGGLVHALGARKRGQTPTLREAFQVGARALWPVAVLNAMVLALVWLLRFLISLPLFLALETTTSATYFTYLVSFLVFLPLVFFLAILQIFALNAMILQGATLAEGITRGYLLIKKHWVIVIETAVLQALISVAIWLIFLVTVLFAMIPLFIFIFASAAIQSVGLFTASMIVGSIIFVCGLVAATAFTIQLQYGTWTYLYRRLGEGGVVPKIHRIVRNITGFFGVPQS